MRRVRVRVDGRVQGVFYRASLREEADRHGVSGWVRNLPDGGVEADLQGTPEAVQALVDWCGQGPPHAQVGEVGTVELTPEGAATGFEIR